MECFSRCPTCLRRNVVNVLAIEGSGAITCSHCGSVFDFVTELPIEKSERDSRYSSEPVFHLKQKSGT